MRVLLQKLLTLVLCISLMPGWMEVLENLEHLLHDGHLVGHDEGEDVASHDALEAEHGCTPVSHSCGCHSSIPAILPSDEPEVDWRTAVVLRDRPQGRSDHPVHRANAPPTPPPRA